MFEVIYECGARFFNSLVRETRKLRVTSAYIWKPTYVHRYLCMYLRYVYSYV